MQLPVWATFLSTAAAVTAAAVAILNYFQGRAAARQAQKSLDEAKRDAASARLLANDLQAASRWHETEVGKRFCDFVEDHGRRLGLVERRLPELATREDVARVSTKMDSAIDQIRDAASGVDRIEEMLMKKALDVR